jgi:hypothetical protein
MSAATSTVDQRIWLHSLPAPGWPPTRIGWVSTPITSAHRQHRQAVESTACAGTSPPEPLSNEAAQAAHADVTRPANRDGDEQSGFCDRSAVSPLSCAPARSESQLSPKTPPIPPEYDGIEYGGLPVKCSGRTEDGVSIPMHPSVRAFVLITLPQLLREPAEQASYALHPISGHPRPVRGLLELLDLNPLPTAGRVVASDLEQVTLDLSPIPLDEALGFRKTHGEAHRKYMRNLRAFVRDLAILDEASRGEALLDRREELADAADDLRRAARKAWRKPLASFGLGIAGSAVALGFGNPIGAGITATHALLGLNRRSDPGSAYSYVFQAREQLSRRR